MLAKSELILAAPPGELLAAQACGLRLAHMAYRVGGGPHLFRANLPVPVRGGYMLMDDAGFDGLGEPGSFCQEVLRECAARGYTGVVCDFEGRSPLLGQVLAQLEGFLEKRGWPLYVPESYAHAVRKAKVLVSTALSGGSLRQRLAEAAERYGAGRVALAVERVAQDFFLPSPTGQGVPLTPAELKALMEERDPSVFFSAELCAHYFTYMSQRSGAHFILFDDASSIRKKLHVARTLDISDALLSYSEVSELLPELLA